MNSSTSRLCALLDESEGFSDAGLVADARRELAELERPALPADALELESELRAVRAALERLPDFRALALPKTSELAEAVVGFLEALQARFDAQTRELLEAEARVAELEERTTATLETTAENGETLPAIGETGEVPAGTPEGSDVPDLAAELEAQPDQLETEPRP